jgi:hypothetical protein
MLPLSCAYARENMAGQVWQILNGMRSGASRLRALEDRLKDSKPRKRPDPRKSPALPFRARTPHLTRESTYVWPSATYANSSAVTPRISP